MKWDSWLIVRDPFLGQTDYRKGKNGTDDRRDQRANEGDNVGCGVRVVGYDWGQIVIHLNTFLSPNDAKE